MTKTKTFLFFLFLVLFISFRLINLTLIPVFADEAIYIHWSQLAWHDATKRFIALTDGKPPLHTWLMIPFLKIIKDPLIAGRLLSVGAGLATLVGVYLIVKKLFSQRMALIAGFLVIISPFLVFYDRLAVADSLLTAFGVWSFYLILKLMEKPDLGRAFLLGFCLGGGLLTKPPALYFIFLSPFIFLFNLSLFWKKNFKKRIFYYLLAFLITVLTYNLIKLSPYSHLISIRSYDYILGKREFLKNPFHLFWGNLKVILIWIYSYQTFLPAILFLLGLALLFKKDYKKGLVFLSWIIFPIFGSAAIGKIIFPRYFLFIQPWIIVFISFGANWLVVKTRSLLKTGSLTLVVYIFTFLPWLVFSGKLIFKPVKAPLIEREQNQYLTTWAAGYGLKEIALYLKTNYPKKKVFVATEGYFGTLPDGLQIYLDGFNNIEVYGIGQPIYQIPKKTLKRAKENPTFLVVNNNRYNGKGEHLELIKEFPKPKFPFLTQSLLFFKVKPE